MIEKVKLLAEVTVKNNFHIQIRSYVGKAELVAGIAVTEDACSL